jgi:YD repeat-containing protein
MKKITFTILMLLAGNVSAINFYWVPTLFGSFFNTGDLGASWEEACQNLYTQNAYDAWNNNGGAGLFDYHPVQYPDLIHPGDPNRYKGCVLEDRSPRNGRLRLQAYVYRQGDSCPVDSTYNNTTGACECTSPAVLNVITQQCELPIDSLKTQGEPPCPACINPTTGNPIHIGTGNKFQTETDYVSNTQGGLSYRRYYNSYGNGLLTRYGKGWSADYWQRIMPIDATEVEVRRPDGKHLRFRLEDNVWTPDADVVLQLEELKDTSDQRTGWLLTLANDTVEEYNNDVSNVGRPIAITTRNGQTTTLEYELTVAEGFDGLWNSLDRVTDAYGRTLTFHYDSNAHLITVKDPAGNDISYTRDTNDNLTSVSYPDETPGNSSDNPTRVYHYEDTNHVNTLTGISDETGNRFASWAYDAEGRAISSEHANGAERVDIVYNTDGTVTVTESNSGTRTYTFETILGVVKPAQITGDKCSNCGSDVESVTYDANGYPTSETDYNGNVTNFTYDARGLQSSRTEAVGTPEERTITTEWHSTFRLPIKITEPGKETIFTYDNQGRLLSKKEQVL